MLNWLVWCFLLMGVGFEQMAEALPIGFGRNQGDLEYRELTSDHFFLYYDKRAPGEARGLINTLELTRPHFERWFEVQRTRPLPVIVSAATYNASFANFITDALELQTYGLGGRDLAIHEYTHSTMYRHLDNLFGPTGSILHLPWMPAWWIEGLAETLSVTVGSDVQAAIERSQALNGDWPSYDKLHSLYLNREGDFALRGYATAGGFVLYLLRTYDAEKLPQLLREFYKKSMPWYWPWAAVPLNGFMPFDDVMIGWTGKDGRSLYEEYQKSAQAYWTQKSGGGKPLFTCAKNCTYAPGRSQTVQREGRAYRLTVSGGVISESALQFGGTESQLGLFRPVQALSGVPTTVTSSYLMTQDAKYFVNRTPDDKGKLWHDLSVWDEKQGVLKSLVHTQAVVSRIFSYGERLYWMEREVERTRLCFVSKKDSRERGCPVEVAQPVTLEYLGELKEKLAAFGESTKHIWLRESTETMVGDRHRLLRVDLGTDRVKSLVIEGGGRPLSMVEERTSGSWLLMASHQDRFLRKLDVGGHCTEERTLADFPNEIFMNDGKLTAFFSTEARDLFLQLDPYALPKRACSTVIDQINPVMVAHASARPLSFSAALARGNIYSVYTDKEAQAHLQAMETQSATDRVVVSGGKIVEGAAKWRGRPVFAFPWIAVDAKGYTGGVMSVPLMDHMQNETLQLSLQYGPESRFLSKELSLVSTRFEPTLKGDLYHRQRYNGSAGDYVLYYEDKGATLAAEQFIRGPNIYMDVGVTSSWLQPLYGPPVFKRKGQRVELSLGVAKSLEWAGLVWSTSARFAVAPEQINSKWVYNQLALGLAASRYLNLMGRRSSLTVGLSGSGTRGKKLMYLREVYRPLATYIPGAGTPLNELNYNLWGPGALTSAKTGDNQARLKASWTIPIIYDLEKLVGIFYFERLDFSAFFNYGNAWDDFTSLKAEDMVKAHGYHFDLKSDIKGVVVNLGLGLGQVIGYDPELYAMLGFNTLIDQ
jgi:hypothetical protein